MKKLTSLFLLAAAVSAHAVVPVEWFPLNEGATNPAATTVYSAAAGSTNNGIFGGTGSAGFPVWETTNLPPGATAAVYFDGTGSTSPRPYISTTYPGVLGTGARTVTVWIKAQPSQPFSGGGHFINWGGGTGSTINAGRYSVKLQPDSSGADAGKLRLEIQGAGINGTRDLRDGLWHHIAVVSTNNSPLSSVKFYIDGNLDPITTSSSANLVINSQDVTTNTTYGVDLLWIGNAGWQPARAFNGALTDVRIYTNALTQSDIQAIIYGPGNAPTFTQQSANQAPVLGDATAMAIFSPGISGSPALYYQWQHAGTNLIGATNLTLTVGPNLTPANLGIYQLIVSNDWGTAISSNAVLNWGTAAISPSSQAVLLGGDATLSVTTPANVSGYTFQWQKNGVNISGATDPILNLNNTTLADDSTNYTVIETLNGNFATSAPPAIVHIVPATASLYANEILADSPAGYWRLGEANGATLAIDQTTFHNGVYSNYNGSQLQQAGALINDADTASAFSTGNFVDVPYADDLAHSNAYTLEAWINPGGIGARGDVFAAYGGLPNAGYELAVDVTGNLVFRTSTNIVSNGSYWNDLIGGLVAVGQWTHVIATYDGQTKSLYTNGVLAASAPEVNFRPAVGVEIFIGAGGSHTVPANAFTGSIDEPAIYRQALSPVQALNHYLAGTVASGTPAAIVTPLQNAGVILGDTNATAIFNVQATGSPNLGFQWFNNSVPINGATNPALVISSLGTAGQSTYTVSVSNHLNSVLSSGASVIYNVPVSPAAATVFTGGNVSYSAVLPAYNTYTYQWQFAGTNIPGATNPVLNLNSVSAASVGGYTVIATLGSLSATSAPATLSIIAAPAQSYADTITADAPVAWWRLGDAPGSALIADVYGNNTAFSYSQFNDVVFGVEGAVLGDHDTAAQFTGYSRAGRLNLAKIEAAYNPALNNQTFSVELWALVTGGAGTARSPLTARESSTGVAHGYAFYAGADNNWQFQLGNGTAFQTVTGSRVEENHWVHLVGTYDGVNAAFYVNGALVGSGPTAYVPDASTVLRIGAGATETNTGNYYFPGRIDEVAVYNTALTATQVLSHYAAAFPANTAPRFTQQTTSHAALIGSSYTLSATVHDPQPVSLQWQQNGTNISGATNATLVINPVSLNSAGTYQLIATSGTVSATNLSTSLAVLPGEVVSGNLEGNSLDLITNHGGIAGYLSTTNWNEFAHSSTAGSVTNLINDNGQPTGISATWKSGNDRFWNGALPAASGDFALLNGFLDTTTNGAITLTLSNVPANYQSAGYSLYLYFGEPAATAGLVNANDTFGAISVGTVTNYYHAIDLSQWDGNFVLATDTNPADATPPDANYAVFTNLNSATVKVSVLPHPTLGGPASLSGFQLVANVAASVPLSITRAGNDLVLTWTGGVLQSKHSLTDSWQDVGGATSPYTIPAPLADQQFYQVR